MEPTRTPKLAPYLLVNDATSFTRFLESGLGGKLTFEVRTSDGIIHHAEVCIADSVVMFADPPKGHAPFPAMLHLYLPDVDAAYSKAIEAGAIPLRAPTVERDGDRRGAVRDAWGNEWWLTTPPKS